jgi:hypothetical protein
MPLRCVGFTDYIGALGAILIMSILLGILSFATIPFGPAAKIVVGGLRFALGLYGLYMFWNMIGTVTGLRGSCPQGYHSGWPPIRGTFYHKGPATGLRADDPMPKMF